MKRILFICSQNYLRSPTAETVFKGKENLEVRSAGMDSNAVSVVTDEILQWAHYIFVMEKAHRDTLQKKYSKAITGKRLVCLDIPDEYDYMDPELVMLLESRVTRYLLDE